MTLHATPGTDGVVAAVVDACRYPLAMLPDITVRHADLPGNISGLWVDAHREIHLASDVEDPTFVVAHELGHAVDSLTLDLPRRAELLDLLHTSRPELGEMRWHHDSTEPSVRGTQLIYPHAEKWNNGATAWEARITEAFADCFVAAFCPSIWPGRIRTIHWPADLAAFRAQVLFPDVPANHPHREAIEWAAAEGLFLGKGDGAFDPDGPVSRGQVATVLRRLKAHL